MVKGLIPISNDLIVNRMKFENSWWISGEVDFEYVVLNKRLYFDLFYKLVAEVDIKRAVVLMGPRRVGKTVLMHHAIDQLLHEHIPQRNICFINIENPLYLNIGLEQLFSLAMKSAGNENPKGWYVFFDEIQYLKDWETHLKVLVDSYPHTKFIVSGSAAAALKLRSNESGAGRFTDFMLPPLTFIEYLNLKNLDGDLMAESKMKWSGKQVNFYNTKKITTLNKHFVDYINFGGYPEVIFNQKIQANLSRFIKSDIIDKVLLRDLPSLYGIQNVQELNSFFTMLVYNTGNELSLDGLSKSSGVNKPTLKKYLEYLEAAFLIKQIHRIDESGKRFQRQNYYKIYLTNPSLRSALFSPLTATDDQMGHMVETAIYAQWLHRESQIPWYARWDKGEVDMVPLNEKTLKPLWAVEIKWSNRCFDDNTELKNLLSFSVKNNLKEVLITTLDKYEVREINGITVHFIPSAVYAFNVGHSTLAKKYSNIIAGNQ